MAKKFSKINVCSCGNGREAMKPNRPYISTVKECDTCAKLRRILFWKFVERAGRILVVY